MNHTLLKDISSEVPYANSAIILKLKNTIIGFVTKGDSAEELEGNLLEFEDTGCEIIVCPVPTRKKIDRCVEQFCEEYKYTLIWINTSSMVHVKGKSTVNRKNTETLFQDIASKIV